ncbi:MAG: SMI1/KNR4 family protein [Beijerinckiaceae bacterium]
MSGAFNPAEFWTAGGAGALDPLTQDSIERVEAYFDVRLPAAYLRVLNGQNGGNAIRHVIPVKHDLEWYGDHVAVDYLNGIGPRPPQGPDFLDYEDHDIYMTPYMIREWGLPEKQVLLSGDGHTWISLDYRRGGEPVVTWIDTDPYNDQVVATSFDEFLAKLLPETVAIDPTTSLLRPEFRL